MALPTWKAKGTFTSGTGALTVPWPTSGTYAVGDFALLFIHSANETIATPSGWTQAPSSPQSTGTAAAAGGVRLAVFYKYAASTSEASVSVADSGSVTAAQIHAFGNVHATNPIHQSAGSVQAATTAMSFPGVTTTFNNCLIVHGCAQDTDAASTATSGAPTNAALGSLTERHDQTVTAGVGGGLVIITGTKDTAGATGNTTSTGSTSVTHAYVTLALASNDTRIDAPVGAATFTRYAPDRGEKFVSPGVGSAAFSSVASRNFKRGYQLQATLTGLNTFDLDTNTPGSLAAGITYENLRGGFFSTSTHGIATSGYTGTTLSTETKKLAFSTETAATASVSGLSGVGSGNSVSSGTAGYIAGGFSPADYVNRTSIVKHAFSTDTATTLSATLTTASNNGAGLSNTDNGYFFQGIGGKKAYKLVFSSESLSDISAANTAMTTQSQSSAQDGTRGHVISDVRSSYEFPFSTEAVSGTSGSTWTFGDGGSSYIQGISSPSLDKAVWLGTDSSSTVVRSMVLSTAVKSQASYALSARDAEGSVAFYYEALVYGVVVVVVEEKTIAVGSGAAQVVGLAPIADRTNIGSNETVNPAQGALSVSGLAPSVSVAAASSVGAAASSVVGLAPSAVQAGPFYTTFYFLNENNNVPGSRRGKGKTAGGTNSTEVITALTNLTAPGDYAFGPSEWITGPNQTAISLDGDWSFDFTAKESSSTADAVLGVSVTVVKVDGEYDFSRDIGISGTAELGTSYGSYPISITLSSGWTLAVGERIAFKLHIGRVTGLIVEAGESASVQYGGTSTYAASVTYPSAMAFDVERLTTAPGVDALAASGFAPTVSVVSYSPELSPGYDTLALSGSAPVSVLGVVTQPAQRAVALSGQTPVLAASKNVFAAPAERALVLAGAAPAISIGAAAQPGVSARVLVGATPDVVTRRFIDVGVRPAVLAGVAPDVVTRRFIDVGTKAMTLAGSAPDVVVRHLVDVGVRAVAVAGAVPDAVTRRFIDVGAKPLALAGAAPSLFQAHVVTPGAGAAALNGLAATVSAQEGRYIDVGAAQVSLGGVLPVAATSSEARPLPGASAVAVSGLAPSVEQVYRIDVAARAVVVAGALPTRVTSHVAAPGVAAVALLGAAPTKAANQIALPGVAAVAFAGAAPSYATGYSVTQQTVTFSGLSPTTAASDIRAAAPSVGVAVISGFAPVVTAGDSRTASPGVGAILVAGLDPVATSGDGRVASPGAGATALSGLAPAVAASDVRTASPAQRAVVFSGAVPSLFQQFVPAPAARAVTLSGLSPVATRTDGAILAVPQGSAALSGLAPVAQVDQPSSGIPVDAGAVYGMGAEPTVVVAEYVDHVATPGAGWIATPAHAGDGYLFASDLTINRLPFAADAPTATAASLAGTAVYYGAAVVSSDTVAYITGAEDSGTYEALNVVQKYVVATDTATIIGQTLTHARDFSGAASTNDAGYILGGYTPDAPYLSAVIDRILFSTDVISATAATLATASSGTAVQSSAAAYLGGRDDEAGHIWTLEKLDLQTITTSAVSDVMSQLRADAAPVSGETKGAFIGGETYGDGYRTEIDTVAFATDAVAASGSSLATERSRATGLSSNSRGYVCGGSTNSGPGSLDVVRFDFASEALGVSAGVLATAQDTMAGASFPEPRLTVTVEVTDPTATFVQVGARAAQVSGLQPAVSFAQFRAPGVDAVVAVGVVPAILITDVTDWVDVFPETSGYAFSGAAPSITLNHNVRPRRATMQFEGTYPRLYEYVNIYRDAEVRAAVANGYAPTLSIGQSAYVGAGNVSTAGLPAVAHRTEGYWIGVAPGAALLSSARLTLAYFGPYPAPGAWFVSRHLTGVHKNVVGASMHKNVVGASMHKNVVRRAVVVSVEAAAMVVNHNG